MQGGPVGLVGWKKIILATLRYFLLPSLVPKGKSKKTEPIKPGKQVPGDHYPLIKLKNMKLQLIAGICKSTVTLVMKAGVILLCLKGVIPFHAILFLLIAGGIIRFMARIISFPATVLAILILIGMLL